MKIKIDGKVLIVTDSNKNIVEIADENGISITAPCFRNKNKGGCCKACIIEADGTQQYACGTQPYEGMEIIYDREDLSKIRKDRLTKYSDAVKSGDRSNNACGCASPSENASSCCGSSKVNFDTEASSNGCCG